MYKLQYKDKEKNNLIRNYSYYFVYQLHQNMDLKILFMFNKSIVETVECFRKFNSGQCNSLINL